MRGLNRLYYIKKDIESIQEEIKNIPELSGIDMSGMPHGNGVGDPTYNLFLKKEKLIEKLLRKIEQYLDELIRLEDILDGIEDVEVRTMARMRFIQNMKWEKIGEKLNYDRTTCSRKVRDYFENHNKKENSISSL